ncbi:MAG: sensor histidine kinase [Acidobacteria bacterium]|nr:MAG: sensor histidine kinase [Acidobacteriota bacterium]
MKLSNVSYNRVVKNNLRRAVIRYVAAATAVFLITIFFRRIHVNNPTTVALTFLLTVLIVSTVWGLRVSVFMAVVATLAFNYYFLPPFGTFTIADPQNWVALFAFLVTAVIASQLSARARREALNANERRHDVERLYSFSQKLLTSDNVVELLNLLPRYIVEAFGVKAAAISLPDRGDVYRSTPDIGSLDSHDLQLVCSRGEPRIDSQRQLALMPLRMGLRTVGSLGVSGSQLSRQTLDAMSSLIAIAIERVRAVENLSRTEAARESEQLRSVLLDSVTHEFRTPLTAIKASVTSLLSGSELAPEQKRELLTVINEESDRLNRLVGEAAEMAQLDANKVELELGPHSIREALDAAIEGSRNILGTHPIEIRLPGDLPKVRMDEARIKEVLMQLLENAAKYSPADAPIQITGEVRNRQLMTSVSDRGAGIDDFEQALIFDKFYRGRNQRMMVQGTGMGLAIAKAIIEAHHGTIGVTSQLGHGSVFYFTLPLV